MLVSARTGGLVATGWEWRWLRIRNGFLYAYRTRDDTRLLEVSRFSCLFLPRALANGVEKMFCIFRSMRY
jgi:hypothetical protein